MMRANPNVCFEVDEYDEAGNGSWRSVIAEGVLEELEGWRPRGPWRCSPSAGVGCQASVRTHRPLGFAGSTDILTPHTVATAPSLHPRGAGDSSGLRAAAQHSLPVEERQPPFL